MNPPCDNIVAFVAGQYFQSYEQLPNPNIVTEQGSNEMPP